MSFRNVGTGQPAISPQRLQTAVKPSAKEDVEATESVDGPAPTAEPEAIDAAADPKADRFEAGEREGALHPGNRNRLGIGAPPTGGPLSGGLTGTQGGLLGATGGGLLGAPVGSLGQLGIPAFKPGMVGGNAAATEAMLQRLASMTPAQRNAAAHLQFPRQVKADHPHKVEVDRVHQELEARGLPASAEGVPVIVAGEGNRSHEGMVVRTVAGEAGIAPGADMRATSTYKNVGFGGTPVDDRTPLAKHIDEVSTRLNEGQGTYQELIENAARSQAKTFEDTARALDAAGAEIPENAPGTVPVNLSWGTTESHGARNVISTILNAPEGSPLHESVKQYLGSDPKADKSVRAELIMRIHGDIQAAAAGPLAAEIGAQRDNAQAAVDRLREKGGLVFAATGNEQAFAGDVLGDDRGAIDVKSQLQGIIQVGNIDQRGTSDRSDDVVNASSSDGGMMIGAPGTNLPVRHEGGMGHQFADNATGTSFASPYAAGVAALMVKANPAITPDQVEAILMDPMNLHDVVGDTRDGLGQIDPVKAVQAAADLGMQ